VGDTGPFSHLYWLHCSLEALLFITFSMLHLFLRCLCTYSSKYPILKHPHICYYFTMRNNISVQHRAVWSDIFCLTHPWTYNVGFVTWILLLTFEARYNITISLVATLSYAEGWMKTFNKILNTFYSVVAKRKWKFLSFKIVIIFFVYNKLQIYLKFAHTLQLMQRCFLSTLCNLRSIFVFTERNMHS
jgi:hypothetical protein